MSNDGGPAFPMPAFDNRAENPADQIWHTQQHGMTLRDWFAGQAMAAMVTQGTMGAPIAATWAYEYADAMLAERDKK